MSDPNDPRTFPAFIIVRTVDAHPWDTVLDLPERILLSSATIASQGRLLKCLSWFASREAAENYMRANNLNGCVVAARSPAEAAEFLGRQNFDGVCVNPRSPGEPPGPRFSYESFLSALDGMRGGGS